MTHSINCLPVGAVNISNGGVVADKAGGAVTKSPHCQLLGAEGILHPKQETAITLKKLDPVPIGQPWGGDVHMVPSDTRFSFQALEPLL